MATRKGWEREGDERKGEMGQNMERKGNPLGASCRGVPEGWVFVDSVELTMCV